MREEREREREVRGERRRGDVNAVEREMGRRTAVMAAMRKRRRVGGFHVETYRK